eukprot:TRINITY_DN1505_c0_g1_i1.p1 TRINITY_DN1505_c0_g1~~TRINITY_DN1505_c0_g1_i1.p1  ORF type:complete len:418 (+),score=54.74 TRINITY_DN1505_c0_g1_i1:144-1256(+)
MVVYGGGMIDKCYEDVFVMDLATGVWERMETEKRVAVPKTLSQTAVVWKDKMVTYGGMTMTETGCISSVYELTLKGANVWNAVATTGPTPQGRKGHAAAIYNSKMYVFFGADLRSNPFSDVSCLDLTTKTWRQVTTNTRQPAGRQGHTVATYGSKAYLFGGMTRDGLKMSWKNDLWVFDFITETWTELYTPANTRPKGRYSQSSWCTGRYVYIFGGDANEFTKYFNDLWRYDLVLGKWEEVKLHGDVPSPRSGHGVGVWGGCAYIYGGEKPRKRSLGGSSAVQVSYSSTTYKLPHFVDHHTSLKDIAARYLLSNSIPVNPSSIPPDVFATLTNLAPKGPHNKKRPRNTPTSASANVKRKPSRLCVSPPGL